MIPLTVIICILPNSPIAKGTRSQVGVARRRRLFEIFVNVFHSFALFKLALIAVVIATKICQFVAAADRQAGGDRVEVFGEHCVALVSQRPSGTSASQQVDQNPKRVLQLTETADWRLN